MLEGTKLDLAKVMKEQIKNGDNIIVTPSLYTEFDKFFLRISKYRELYEGENERNIEEYTDFKEFNSDKQRIERNYDGDIDISIVNSNNEKILLFRANIYVSKKGLKDSLTEFFSSAYRNDLPFSDVEYDLKLENNVENLDYEIIEYIKESIIEYIDYLKLNYFERLINIKYNELREKAEKEENKRYLKYYKDQLDLNPLDADLQETIKRMERIIEIGEEFEKLSEELRILKGE